MTKIAFFVAVNLVFLYAAFGIVCALMTETGSRLRARVATVFIWPYLISIDGTPAIRPFLRWARGEIVIEASEWPLGVERLTVQRRDGSEYTETNDCRRFASTPAPTKEPTP